MIDTIAVIPHRGRGEYFRLGSDASTNIKVPHKVEGLAHKKVVQVAVGAMHCLALTDNGEVRERERGREREGGGTVEHIKNTSLQQALVLIADTSL